MPSASDPFDIAASIQSALQVGQEDIGTLYLALTFGLVRLPGIALRSGHHGFISKEMRFYRDGHWCLSLVPNQKWVRLYIRRPELRRNRIAPVSFVSAFPMAEVTAREEIAINIAGETVARPILEWLDRYL